MVGQQFTQDTARCPEVNITWQFQCHICSIDKEHCGSFSLFYKFLQVHLMFFRVHNCGEWKGFSCIWHQFNTSVVCQKRIGIKNYRMYIQTSFCHFHKISTEHWWKQLRSLCAFKKLSQTISNDIP